MHEEKPQFKLGGYRPRSFQIIKKTTSRLNPNVTKNHAQVMTWYGTDPSRFKEDHV